MVNNGTLADVETIGIVTDYASLIAGLRLVAAQRGIAIGGEEVAQVAGVASGYLARILAPRAKHGLGMIAFGPILQVLGVRLLMVRDDDAIRRFSSRIGKRRETHVRHGVGCLADATHPAVRAAFIKRIGSKGGISRAAKLSPKRRSESARKAAIARWKRHRVAKALAASTAAPAGPGPTIPI